MANSSPPSMARFLWNPIAAEMLLLGYPTAPFPVAERALAPFRPSLVHAGKLRAGPLVLRVWLVRLSAY